MCAPVRADTRRGGRRRKDEWGGQSSGRKKKEHQQKEDRKGKRAEMSSRWRGICGAGRGRRTLAEVDVGGGGAHKNSVCACVQGKRVSRRGKH